jgi:hypothetical protein
VLVPAVSDENLIVPLTSNLYKGVATPIPTLPPTYSVLVTLTLLSPFPTEKISDPIKGELLKNLVPPYVGAAPISIPVCQAITNLVCVLMPLA